MKTRILIIGGYGNFGSFISRRLAQDKSLIILISGRSIEKAQALAHQIGENCEGIALDITHDFKTALSTFKPDIVIHTSGPFQGQSYDVAKACIAQGVHYIDLADGREFVKNIENLHHEAQEKGVLVISGASSVPCLTSAIVDYYKSEFQSLEALDYGIVTAQKTGRGLATTKAILSYVGRPFTTLIDGKMRTIYGWQGLRMRQCPGLGRRCLSHCNIPDLSLFPERYPSLKTIHFYAGLELPFIHCGLWLLSWLVRFGIIKNLEKAAPLLLKTSNVFDVLGSDKSGFYMVLSGTDHNGKSKNITFNLTAYSGDGPYIPCIPSILIAQKLSKGAIDGAGAKPCMGMITLDEYLTALDDLNIDFGIT